MKTFTFVAVLALGVIIGWVGMAMLSSRAYTGLLEDVKLLQIEKATLINQVNGCRAEAFQLREERLESPGPLEAAEVNLNLFVSQYFTENPDAEQLCFGRGWLREIE